MSTRRTRAHHNRMNETKEDSQDATSGGEMAQETHLHPNQNSKYDCEWKSDPTDGEALYWTDEEGVRHARVMERMTLEFG
jgi:hypothetical protein